MAKTAAKQSTLGHLSGGALQGDAIRLVECPLRGRINLRGNADDPTFVAAVAGAIGIEPPTAANTARRDREATVLWLGPNEWLIETDAEAEAATAAALDRAFDSVHAAATVVGDATTTVSLAGLRAPDVLAKGMTLDIDPARFRAGHCARSLLAKATVMLHRPGEEIAYEITVGRSFADYVWRWLKDAALEYDPRAGD